MKKLLPILLVLCAFNSKAQMKYLEMSNDSNANFYDIKREFENYWKDRPYTRGSGYNVFKRWAAYMEPRVYPSGSLKGVGRSRAYEERRKQEEAMAQNKLIGNTAAPTSTTASWVALGPFGSANNTGAGRLQCVRFMPGLPTTIFVGAAAGGLWKSTDNGATWTTNTDQLASLGVADITIDPTNTNIMYLATGDLDGSGSGFSFGDTKSTGVLKSTDGGATWNTTGLSWTTSQQRFISKLLLNPQNTGEVFAFTSVGIYRTRDAAATWTLVTNGNFKDAEYKPGDTTTIYAANGAVLMHSTNGGQSFTGTTFPSAGLNRIAIAVTPADPNYVYVLGSKTSNSCFGGLWRSTNSATSFSLMSSTPNVLDGTATGSSTSAGQGWYDLAIGASPANKDEITVGGVNTWKSVNGGANWTLNTCWNNAVCGSGPSYSHADQHDIVYLNGTTNYLCNDGGLSRTTNSGTSYTTINGTMNISEPYFLGLSASNPNLIVAGLQDNGTVLWNGSTWNRIYSGDGMDCFIDWSNNNVIIAAYVNGAFAKSTNGGASFSNIVTGLTGTGNWVAP
ncbi:MAG: WD40/YVTN/BNR-like repeat-containing protein, partial [Bacteroidia bacterium]